MMNVNIVSSSSKEIQDEINRLEFTLTTLKNELVRRKGVDIKKYGFITYAGYEAYDTFAQAANAAVKYYKDPDAAYKVINVYM